MVSFENYETAANEEMEYARENDYVRYFNILMEQASFGDDAYIVRLFDEHWDKVKEAVKKDYCHVLADGTVAKPSPEHMMSLRDGIQMLIGNDINDIEMALSNMKRYDDRASFARDVLEIFDLENAEGKISLDFMNFSLAIGEALSDAGHIEESDTYYEQLLAQYPDNGYMIANYVLTLKLRGENKRAKELLEKHISLEMEPIEENDMLFERAIELYEEEGNIELAKQYEALQKQIHGYVGNADLSKYSDILHELYVSDRTVIREEKKIYPNEPCPCGSGKKYKKCCGKN